MSKLLKILTIMSVFIAQAWGTEIVLPGGIRLPVQDPPSRYRFVRAFEKMGTFEGPIFITSANDGTNRLFVVERLGSILSFENQEDIEKPFLFLDLTEEVGTDWWEEGLLGLAFDPDFKTNRYFYVYFTHPKPNLEVVVRRYQVLQDKPNKADPKSGLDILRVPLLAPEHLGGMMEFGPDGMLYIGIGDGVAPDKEEQVIPHGKTLRGSMLRIDVKSASKQKPYRIPKDNPFVDGKLGILPEIYAYGLRSHWRWSFDKLTGKLWLGEAGNHLKEEILLIEKGGNYGWPFYEGNLRFSKIPYEPSPVPPSFPLLEYGRETGFCAIGGYVYRGKKIPSLVGSYIYGDFTPLPEPAPVWAMKYDETNKIVVSNQLIGGIARLSSFGVDEQGEIYALSLQDGSIWRLEEDPQFMINPKSSLPEKLSETGLFESLSPLKTSPVLKPYNVEKAFWSDGATKQRWFALPKGQAISKNESGQTVFPKGSVFVKHFLSDKTQKPIETRILLQQKDGWRGYAYRWNTEASDAELVPDEGETFQLADWQKNQVHWDQHVNKWTIPSRMQCFSCHTNQAGVVLGFSTQDLNPQPKPMEDQVRQYLKTNCANCHRPGGVTRVELDFTDQVAPSSYANKHSLAGELGGEGGALIVPGRKEKSSLWLRLNRTQQGAMPPLGRHTIDPEAVELIGRWIDEMK